MLRVADAASVQGVDITNLPISSEDLKAEIQKCRTQTDFYEVIMRGHENQLDLVVIDALRALKDKNPNDALLLSAYCMALQTYEHPVAGPHEYDDDLKLALKLGPNLWMPLVLQGTSLVWYSDPKKGLDLLQKAVGLASDVSIKHYYLAQGYMFCVHAKPCPPDSPK